jgi:hypothetical protein
MRLPRITPLVLKRRAAAFDHSDWLFELGRYLYDRQRI